MKRFTNSKSNLKIILQLVLLPWRNGDDILFPSSPEKHRYKPLVLYTQ